MISKYNRTFLYTKYKKFFRNEQDEEEFKIKKLTPKVINLVLIN